jgi:hypothetical protein
MYRAILVLAAAIGAAVFAPAARACIDDAPCPPRIPNYQQYIPRGVPGIPSIPKGELPDPPAIPKALPKPPTAQQKTPKKVEGADASGAAPKASENDVRVVEKPAAAGAPERGPVCTRYLPSLGKAVEIPCE